MYAKLYLLEVVGIFSLERNPDECYFKCKSKRYKQLCPSNVFRCLLGSHSKIHQFQLHTLSNYNEDGQTYLGLFFVPSREVLPCTSNSEIRLIQQYFTFNIPLLNNATQSPELNDPETFVDGDYDNTIKEDDNSNPSVKLNGDDINDSNPSMELEDELTPLSLHPRKQKSNIALLYKLLRDAHVDDVLNTKVPKNIQHKCLRPILRPYQQNAVKWMIHRELTTEYLPCEYVSGKCANLPELHCFIHYRKMHIVEANPGDIKIPTGGILADEMGLGKTVETLALILNHRKKKRKLFELSSLGKKVASFRVIKCVCNLKRTTNKKTICCTVCGFLQHKNCVFKYGETHKDCYACPSCWNTQQHVESGATIIVSPTSIKTQWQSEITKHIANQGLKVFSYDGVKNSGWISPLQLAEYDVVITDYNVLRSEIYFTKTDESHSDRCLRGDRKFQNLVSPLPLIRWWRVCLDEAQMVETPQNSCAKMVKLLPAVHRWSVTGTPIEKTIDNLYGLLFFMDCQPYTEFPMWQAIANAFPHDDPSLLVNVLKKVMWRTCKSTVLDQVNIPPQTEVVHKVQLGDVEVLFYKEELQSCSAAFWERAIRIEANVIMSKIDRKALKALMAPLLKMRQNCSSPAILFKSDQSAVRRMLTPTELHTHLVNNNEIAAKTQLRTIASTLNGMGGLCILKDQIDLAKRYYKAVLRKASDYTGNVCVDSLLQIHALHNLMDISDEEDPCVVSYRTEYGRLEWKFIENHYSIVKSVAQTFETENGNVLELEESLGATPSNAWRIIFDDLNNTATDLLLEKIAQEVVDNYGGKELSWQRTNGLDYVLTKWLEDLKAARTKVLKQFKPLRFLTRDLKPKSEMSLELINQIDSISSKALACHLDKKGDTSDVITIKVKCPLCKLHLQILEYETFVFDKHLDTEVQNQGSWKPAMCEWIIKTIVMFAKKESRDRHIVDSAVELLQYLEVVRKEFKELSKLWMETNHLVSAFDELNMCKMRLQLSNKDELVSGVISRQLFMESFRIDEAITDMQNQLNEAEKHFARRQGTLKYLNHLSKNSDLKQCPICGELPKEKYVVFECGHHVCLICLAQIKKSYPKWVTCAVCRYKQNITDMYVINSRPKLTNSINGHYSSKISTIVQTILELRIAEPDIKIVLFSHWDQILNVIGSALKDNNITFILKSRNGVDQFKCLRSGITCLLLPLAYGSKGLNLTEASHVFLVEPILNTADELQAIGRIHRIGQTKPTFVHRFIVKNTVEEKIFNAVSSDVDGVWATNQITVKQIEELFKFDDQN